MAPPTGLVFCLLLLLAVPPGGQALWPLPEAVTPGSRLLCVSNKLKWRPVGFGSKILEEGFDRYSAILAATPTGIGRDDEFGERGGLQQAGNATAGAAAGDVERRRRHRHRCHLVGSVEVSVTSSDQSLNLETRESYSLDVDAPAILIQANSVYGALRAMETLSQLVRRRPRTAVNQAAGEAQEALPGDAVWPGLREDDDTVLLVDEVDIYDAPRFRYRGLMIDTARHFLPVSVIKAHLDAMAMAKMNCLHWHMVDDESFPWMLAELPELAAQGAFAPEAVYTTADIKEVVDYARARAIRVIPELDTPGHTRSWGKSYPGLLTQCYDSSSGEPSGQLGPINPARNETFGFIWRLLREAARDFPDPYIHLGGDEVVHDCWKSNPEVQEFMRQKGFGQDFQKLEGYYMQQVVHLAATAGKAAIVWQEAFDQGVPLPPGTRIQVWKWWEDKQEEQQQQQQQQQEDSSTIEGGGAGIGLGTAAGVGGGAAASRRRILQQQQQQQAPLACGAAASGCGAAGDGDEAWKAELQAVTKQGYDAILSAPWYLNLGSYAGQDWQQYYAVDPHDFKGTQEQKDHLLGGEACAWGEYIDAVNSINRVWPRAAAVAERLWSPQDATDVEDATARLADLRCRMLARGIAAQSMGPGFCPGELTTRM